MPAYRSLPNSVASFKFCANYVSAQIEQVSEVHSSTHPFHKSATHTLRTRLKNLKKRCFELESSRSKDFLVQKIALVFASSSNQNF